MRRRGSEALRITLELTSLDEESTALLARRILRIPTVLEVQRNWLGQRDQLAA